MPDFSEYDINAAKRRVQEMKNRAQRFTDDEVRHDKPKPSDKNITGNNKNNTSDEQISGKEDDKSLFIILALILLLSKEGADNSLILALLYLLL